MSNKGRFAADERKALANRKLRYKCKYCGWFNFIAPKFTKIVCKNCGHYVFRNNKDEFIHRMKERLNYDKRKGNSENNTSKK